LSTYTVWPDLGPNPDRRDQEPATKRLNCGTAWYLGRKNETGRWKLDKCMCECVVVVTKKTFVEYWQLSRNSVKVHGHRYYRTVDLNHYINRFRHCCRTRHWSTSQKERSYAKHQYLYNVSSDIRELHFNIILRFMIITPMWYLTCLSEFNEQRGRWDETFYYVTVRNNDLKFGKSELCDILCNNDNSDSYKHISTLSLSLHLQGMPQTTSNIPED
jgi:hypothetical protein